MKITDVRTIALSGATHDHGWPGGTDPDEQKNTLLEVKTDEGLTGIGSCYTSRALVEASLQLLQPMLIGETGLEAERVAEKLRQMTFWQGRGGAVEHTISGVDIALWDLLGKALGAPVWALLGGAVRPRLVPLDINSNQVVPMREQLFLHVLRVGKRLLFIDPRTKAIPRIPSHGGALGPMPECRRGLLPSRFRGGQGCENAQADGNNDRK
jgi:L-alanine-DL-glutamate epimerase-like enolase superfamily enzyme